MARTPIIYSLSSAMNDQGVVFQAKLGLSTLEDLEFLVTSPARAADPARERGERAP
jgi:hypothetical protein